MGFFFFNYVKTFVINMKIIDYKDREIVVHLVLERE